MVKNIERSVLMYYVTDAIETLKKYGYYTNAEIDIKRKKIASVVLEYK